MTPPFDAGALVRDARRAAGLSQRELARRAGTAQSVVARVESGRTSPSSATLARLLGAAGRELRVELSPIPVTDSHMLDDVARILRLTAEQRLIEVRNLSRFVSAARRA
ncbi:MAG TPA: helix-turn-helix transcriptional regulator [Gemmatimonadaceae bacterium]|nr:helix-turn-helix transcriptional regulator [Gemmatimonadaceae bacterium]